MLTFRDTLQSKAPRLHLALLLIVWSALLWPGVAGAQPTSEQDLLRRGYRQLAAGNPEGALSSFGQAYDLDHSPRAAAQMGLAEVALERWVDAEAHLREALAAEQDAWITRHRSGLERVLGDILAHLGTLDLEGEPGGSRLSVDGEDRGQAPFANLHLSPGDHSVRVELEGTVLFERSISIEEGATIRIEVPAPEIPEPPEGPQNSDGELDGDEGEQDGGQHDGHDPAEDELGIWLPGIAVAGAGGAAVIAGAIVGALALIESAPFREMCSAEGVCPDSAWPDLQARRESVQLYTTLADALLWGGLSFVGAGLLTAFLIDKDASSDDTHRAGLSCSPSGCTLQWSSRF